MDLFIYLSLVSCFVVVLLFIIQYFLVRENKLKKEMLEEEIKTKEAIKRIVKKMLILKEENKRLCSKSEIESKLK